MWLSGIFIEWTLPYFEKLIYLNLVADKAYSLVCHQDSEKLITGGIYSSKVCARCTGIYSGAVLTIVILFFLKISKKINIKYLLISSIPILLDIIFYNIGIYSYSKSIAFTTGILFGSAGFFYIASGIDKFIHEVEGSKF
jgi:uncharacterized membrane protein